MTYYRDLSEYTFSGSVIPNLSVGWLSRWRPFATGVVDSEILEILASQVRMPRSQTRGIHPCYFCSALRGVKVSVNIRDVEHNLGSAEIHALSRSGEIYSAPNLIYHYIDRHGYRPPDEFLQAIVDGAEGRVGGSTIHRLREIAEGAPRMEDRVDAAIDLLQVSPASSADWLSEIIELPTCHPYVKLRVKTMLRML